jgi:hypothetical protein
MLLLKNILSPYLLLILLSLIFTIGISLDYDAIWTIRNNTEHYIHIMVNNKSYLYVRSHNSIKVETNARNVEIEAFYAPGQLIAGSVTRNYTAASSDERGCEGCPIAPDSKYSVTFVPQDFH